MFDAPASATAQLSDWTYLGTLYSGGEVDLERMARVLLEEYRSSKLGRFTFETPQMLKEAVQ